MKDELASATVKVAPPVAVTGANMLFHMTINEWVAVATLIYVVLQTFFLLKDRLGKKRKG